MTFISDNNSNEQNLDNYQTSNLTFIDTNLTNYQSLIPDGNDSNVILIDSQSNGIEQITEALEKYSNLDSVSIFSHGDVGSLQLGNAYLSSGNLDNYQDDLTAWGNSLSATGDFLLYGCNVGASQAGLDFVDRVADLTNADVAASNDLTGNALLGGDWTLEVAVGTVEATTVDVTDYDGVLYYFNTSNSDSTITINNSPTYGNTNYSNTISNSGLKFNFTYDTGTTVAQKTAFEYAGRAWANLLNDDVTINLHVSMVNNSELPGNTLGGAVPFFHQGTSYTQAKNQLNYDRSSNDDNIAVSNLDNSSTLQTARPSHTHTGEWAYVDQVAMTRGNAKALGLVDSNNSTLDGIIVMNNLQGTGVGWEYNYMSNGIARNKLDFTTVAIHEIGHTLGFVSLVDGLTNSNYWDYETINTNSTTLDLYRFMGREFRSIRTGGDAYFSIDRGMSNIARTSGGVGDIGGDSWADGYQGSHWKNPDNSGIMDPLLELGVRRDISDLDLRAMDVIGWDRHVGSSSKSSLWSQAQNEANLTGNINRNVEVGQMLKDWRWARRGSRDLLRQSTNIGQFLAQEGFFSVGSFRESFDFSSVNSAATNNFVVDNQSSVSEFPSNDDSTVETDSDTFAKVDVPEVIATDEGINYEQMLALVTNGLSNNELSQLSLDDLGKLIEQQLADSLV